MEILRTFSSAATRIRSTLRTSFRTWSHHCLGQEPIQPSFQWTRSVTPAFRRPLPGYRTQKSDQEAPHTAADERVNSLIMGITQQFACRHLGRSAATMKALAITRTQNSIAGYDIREAASS